MIQLCIKPQLSQNVSQLGSVDQKIFPISRGIDKKSPFLVFEKVEHIKS